MKLSEAYLAQARSDLEAYERLTRTSLPSCHRLHYLQMWLEKLCKAYLPPDYPEELQFKHQVVSKVLPRLVQKYMQRTPGNFNDIRGLCREIDLLHPQPDSARRRQDNVEYPWPTDGSQPVHVRAHWKFPLTGKLGSQQGRLLLKVCETLTLRPVGAVLPSLRS